MAVPGQEAPKRSRVLSFTGSSTKSEKTHKSSGSRRKIDLSETHEEKEANRPHTHADPSRAIRELQPSAVALEKSNLESLRSVQHKDIYGNPITDPDLSNPTRYRFERPLDTIRSFEAAINGNYTNRRASYARPDESANGGYSRRSSYFGDRGGGPSNHRNGGYNEQTNYSAHRPVPSRPDSYAESHGGGNYNGYSNGYNNGNNYQPRPPRHGGRMNPDQYVQGYGNNNYPHSQQYPPQYPPSDNYASASGSSSDVLATYTDPSSTNSAGDDNLMYRQQNQKPEQTSAETYGFNGFGDTPDLDYPQQPSSNNNGYHQDPVPSTAHYNGSTNHKYNGSQALATPSIPPKDVGGGAGLSSNPSVVRKPIASFSSSSPKTPAATATASPEKRKSFFKRFSKS